MASKFFFALMAPASIAIDLLRLQSRVRDGVLVPRHNLHVTMNFIGSPKDRLYPREELTEVGNDVMTLAPRAHSLTFGEVQHWARSKCIVLTPVEGVPLLAQLHSDIHTMLHKHGFTRVSDFGDFRPHLTLAKPVTKPPAQAITRLSPIRMDVTSFALIESTGGGTYTQVKSWDLLP